uniref:Uncharacterized protein n=1 Tax=Solanum tuberosum TaxID=4113 RepID=M1DZ52_SOLTU
MVHAWTISEGPIHRPTYDPWPTSQTVVGPSWMTLGSSEKDAILGFSNMGCYRQCERNFQNHDLYNIKKSMYALEHLRGASHEGHPRLVNGTTNRRSGLWMGTQTGVKAVGTTAETNGPFVGPRSTYFYLHFPKCGVRQSGFSVSWLVVEFEILSFGWLRELNGNAYPLIWGELKLLMRFKYVPKWYPKLYHVDPGRQGLRLKFDICGSLGLYLVLDDWCNLNYITPFTVAYLRLP